MTKEKYKKYEKHNYLNQIKGVSRQPDFIKKKTKTSLMSWLKEIEIFDE